MLERNKCYVRARTAQSRGESTCYLEAQGHLEVARERIILQVTEILRADRMRLVYLGAKTWSTLPIRDCAKPTRDCQNTAAVPPEDSSALLSAALNLLLFQDSNGNPYLAHIVTAMPIFKGLSLRALAALSARAALALLHRGLPRRASP